MTNPTDIISRTRTLCKAATPGPWEMNSVRTDSGRDHFVQSPTGVRVRGLADVELIAAAPELMMELVTALEEAHGDIDTMHKPLIALLEMKVERLQLQLQAFQHLAKTEASRIKAAYRDGRDAREDDRESEHD